MWGGGSQHNPQQQQQNIYGNQNVSPHHTSHHPHGSQLQQVTQNQSNMQVHQGIPSQSQVPQMSQGIIHNVPHNMQLPPNPNIQHGGSHIHQHYSLPQNISGPNSAIQQNISHQRQNIPMQQNINLGSVPNKNIYSQSNQQNMQQNVASFSQQYNQPNATQINPMINQQNQFQQPVNALRNPITSVNQQYSKYNPQLLGQTKFDQQLPQPTNNITMSVNQLTSNQMPNIPLTNTIVPEQLTLEEKKQREAARNELNTTLRHSLTSQVVVPFLGRQEGSQLVITYNKLSRVTNKALPPIPVESCKEIKNESIQALNSSVENLLCQNIAIASLNPNEALDIPQNKIWTMQCISEGALHSFPLRTCLHNACSISKNETDNKTRSAELSVANALNNLYNMVSPNLW